MIIYVDTSSLLKLLIDEPGSAQVAVLWDVADVVASASLLVVEARAALAAAERAGRLTSAQLRSAKAELKALVDELTIVEITELLISRAADVAESEALRGYDAVHLAAAIEIEADILTSADAALCEAAEHRGFLVSNPLDF